MTGHPRRSLPSHDERAPSRARFEGWEARIYPGLQLEAAPIETRQALASALGVVGVEAEYLLRLLEDFPGVAGPSAAAGAALLARLEAFAARLVLVATELEVATQAYITSVTESGVGAQRPPGADEPTEAEPWWPPFDGWALSGEPLALRLRRCGYSYRQLVAVRLPDTVETIAERLALVLHALDTLPPAGTLPVAALAQGLAELADAVQGDVVPHFIRDLSPSYPGLPTAIERLRRLATKEDRSLAGDIAWARQQYAAVAGAAAVAKTSAPGVFARLFGGSSARAARASGGTARWAEQAAQEWRALIAALEAIERTQPRAKAKGPR